MAQTHQSLIACLNPTQRRDPLARSGAAGLPHLAGHGGAVATVCARLVFRPPKWFRYFHFNHHRFTVDPENDPESAAASFNRG